MSLIGALAAKGSTAKFKCARIGFARVSKGGRRWCRDGVWFHGSCHVTNSRYLLCTLYVEISELGLLRNRLMNMIPVNELVKLMKHVDCLQLFLRSKLKHIFDEHFPLQFIPSALQFIVKCFDAWMKRSYSIILDGCVCSWKLFVYVWKWQCAL